MPDARDSGTTREDGSGMGLIERDDDPERTKRDQARREFNEGWAKAVASADHGLTGDAGEVERLRHQLAEAVEALFASGDAVSHRESAEAVLAVVDQYIDQRLRGAVEERDRLRAAIEHVLGHGEIGKQSMHRLREALYLTGGQ